MARQTQRRLSTVLAVDVVGYTRLMEADEDGTHNRLMRLRSEVLDPAVSANAGRIVKNTGDGFLSAFDCPVEATRCAVELQKTLTNLAECEQPDRRLLLRMGINTCVTIVEADDIYGEGVNVAARLQAYAEPGDIVMSLAVVERTADCLVGIPQVDLGNLHLKNINKPVRAVGLRIGSASRMVRPSLYHAPDDRPGIAVLPLRKLHPNPEEAYFADGIVEEIIHALGGLKELFVISRTSTLSYSGSEIDAQAIGRELCVRYVLYGSVRRDGGRLRLSTELSDAETGRIIRSDQYDGELSDLFQLQARISIEVARAIVPHVREWELRRAMRKHPENLTAYDLVLQSLEYLYRLDYESHSKARGLLQQAIGHDPDYGPAYTHIAYWHIFRVGEGWSSDAAGDATEAARVAASAIQRDPNDALALAIYGHVQSFLLKDYGTARAYLERAIEVGPNCANAWTMSSASYGYVGDGATAVEHAERGLRLSPLDAHVFWHEAILAQAHYISGQYGDAVAWGQRAAGHNASAIFNLRTLAASLVALKRDGGARQTAERILRGHPNFRLSTYAPRCPFRRPILDTWIERLRLAGLPE